MQTLSILRVTDISTCWFFGSITDYDIHGEISSSLLKWLDRVSHFNATEIALKAFIVVYIINDISDISVLLFMLE
jgi:hypothetical protein